MINNTRTGFRHVIAALFVAAFTVSTSADQVTLKPAPLAEWAAIAHDQKPGVVAPQVGAAPMIDGDLSDTAWRDAGVITESPFASNVPPEARSWIDVRFVHTVDAIIIGAKLARPGSVLRAEITKDDGRVWTDDALEIYLYNPDTRRQYQLIVNANGKRAAVIPGSSETWSPNTTVAAQKSADGWTVEVALPFAALHDMQPAANALLMQVRYLVNQQSAYVAWRPGHQPGQAGILAFDPQDLSGKQARVTATRIPTVAPQGKATAGYEIHNPDSTTRRVVARIYHLPDRKVAAQELVDIPAGETKRVELTFDMPDAGEIQKLFYVRDAVDDKAILNVQQTITTLQPINLTLWRERYWYGDQAINGQIEIGAADASDLSIELWSVTHRVMQGGVARLDDRRYDLSLNVGDLDPGSYRMIVSCRAGDQILTRAFPIELKQGAPLPASKKIAIHTDWPEGVNDGASAPLYVGLSFPGGMLTDPANVRIVDAAGRVAPSQARPVARWSKGGSIRWLAVTFTGTRGTDYFAEVGSDVANRATAGINVNETGAAYAIDTGEAKFELPKAGPLFGKAWRNGQLILEGGKPCLVIVDQDGRTADETRTGDGESPVIETQGPQQVVVRREGVYRTESGEELARFIVRVTFDAGSPVARVQHTLIQTRDTNTLQFRDVAVRVHPIMQGAQRVAPLNKTIQPGEALSVTQVDHYHHHRGENRYVVNEMRGGQWRQTGEGELADNWLSIPTVAIAVRHFTETFPKELEIGPDGLTAHLWSSRGGRLLDYRVTAAIDFLGRDWIDQSYPGGAKAMSNMHADASGTARTHELSIHLLGSGNDAATVAKLTDDPPLALQDAQWLRSSEALGMVSPRDAQKFPQAETFIENYFTQMIQGQAEGWGDYGYLDYGAGPHFFNSRYNHPAKNKPRAGYRYNGMDYNFRTTVWLAYARSGDRRYFTWADAYNTHLSDYHFSHHDAGGRKPKGAQIGISGSNETPIYWAGNTGRFPTGAPTSPQGADIDNLLYEYFLTGDRHVHDVVTWFAKRMKDHFDPTMLPDLGATSTFHLPYAYLAILYEHTWDEALAEKLIASRRRMLDVETSTGLANVEYYGALHKSGTHMWAAAMDYRATGSDLARRALLRYADYIMNGTPGGDTGYQDHTGYYLSLAYRLTGDQRMASWIDTRINRVIYRNMDDDGVIADYAYAGAQSPNVLETFIYGLDTVDRAPKPLAPTPLLARGLPAYDVDLVFRKDRNKPLWLDISFEHDWDLQVIANDAEQFQRDRGKYVGGVELNLKPSYFSGDLPGLGGGTGRVILPTEAVGGDYRLTGVSSINYSDGDKLVMVAREGVYLDGASASPPTWYLAIPAGKSGGIYANAPVSVTLEGQVRDIEPGTWLDIAATGSDRVAALTCRGYAYIRFRGDLPAVLTTHDPDRLFIPRTDATPLPLPDLPPVSGHYTTGIAGEALALSGSRRLAIPRGENVGGKRFAHIDYERGTIELWLRPRWSAPMLIETHNRPLFTGALFPLHYSVVVPDRIDGRMLARNFNLFEMNIWGEAGFPAVQRHYKPQPLRQGDWYHLAFCWDTHPTRGWIAELYVNGEPSNPDNRPHVGLSHWGENDRTHKPMVIGVPGMEHLLLMGDIESDIDELRISNVPRYPQPFESLKPQPFDRDEHTLLLMRFDGNLNAVKGDVGAQY